AFVMRNNKYYEVILHPGDPAAMPMPEDHHAVLIAKTRYIDPATTWTPDYIGHVQNGQTPFWDQVGVWVLKGLSLTFPQSANNLGAWQNRGDALSLGLANPRSTVRTVADIRAGTTRLPARPDTAVITID